MPDIPLITEQIVRADRKTDPTNFPTKINTFMATFPAIADQMNAMALGMNALAPSISLAAGIAASSAAAAYNPATSYAWPNIVSGSDGCTYRCTVSPGPLVGENPVGSVTGHWVIISRDTTNRSFRNLLVNSAFRVNQRQVSGTVVLAAGAYGHDRWKAGASGCTYTFAVANGLTTLTITAGSLQQVIAAENIPGGTNPFVLTWAGTAQGKIGGGSYSASGVSAQVTGGSNLTIEFGVGTLALPQLEFGYTPSAYEWTPYDIDQERCLRYFWRCGGVAPYDALGIGFVTGSNGGWLAVKFPVRMRTAPQITNTITPGNYSIEVGGGASALTSLAATGAISSTWDMMILNWGTGGTWTIGNCCLLYAYGTVAGKIDFSAEV
jgi:hypothetical protein